MDGEALSTSAPSAQAFDTELAWYAGLLGEVRDHQGR